MKKHKAYKPPLEYGSKTKLEEVLKKQKNQDRGDIQSFGQSVVDLIRFTNLDQVK